MLKVAAESKAGRVGILDLEHMTIFEETESFTFDNRQQSRPSWLEVYLEQPNALLKNFAGVTTSRSPVHTLWRGGFATLVNKDDAFVADYFNSYIRTYLERNALYADATTASPEFARFLKKETLLIAQAHTQTPEYNCVLHVYRQNRALASHPLLAQVIGQE